VIGPQGDVLRDHVQQFSRDRFEIQCVVQTAPLGTAHALAMASEFAAEDPFLTINADNYYPIDVLARLRTGNGSAVAAFRPEGLCRGNITPDRLRHYALISTDTAGRLMNLQEKPGDVFSMSGDGTVLINMNSWRFTPSIFKACDAIPLSPRGEYELTDAVLYAIRILREPLEVIEVDEPVLDLSTRADIAEVTRLLAHVEVSL
jgi:glucose-1-phosphate thymidylyltransferase